MPLSPKRHILASFNEALNRLRNDTVKMSSMAERNFTAAVKSLLSRDSHLAERVIVDDEAVDNLEKTIDNSGVEIILRFTPLASDLRQVVATMKISGDLERISDEAVSIARRAAILNQRPEMKETEMVEKIYRDVLDLYRDSVRAFINHNLDLAYAIKPRDKEIDKEYKTVIQILVERMAEFPERTADIFNLTNILRSLERIGDHATNIAEDAVYVEAARDIRHTETGSSSANLPAVAAAAATESN